MASATTNTATATRSIDRPSTNASPASRHITITISAIEPLDTPRKNAENVLERCDNATTRSIKPANTKDGPNIPSVATAAPVIPAMCHPMNVAVVNTGPGVNWPTEMASSNTSDVIHPRSTTSLSRNTNST